MRAVICKKFGPPETLVIEEVPDPTPGEGELLVQVKAAGVSFPDALQIEDKYQYKAQPPYTPGGEVSGVVQAAGVGVEGFAVGDSVCGHSLTGGFAELAVMKASAARPVTEQLGFDAAPGLLYSYGTALYGLRERGHTQPGDDLLVLGAAGALGIATIEVGKMMGARVIAAASTPEKLALAKKSGADEVIDYSREDLKTRTKELTGGKGADVVFDAVGGDYAEAALRATAWEGRFLVIGFTAGIPKIPLNLALLKGCQIVGVFLGAMQGRDPAFAPKLQSDLNEAIESGALRPSVGKRYSLDDAPQALRDLLDRKAIGRLVVLP